MTSILRCPPCAYHLDSASNLELPRADKHLGQTLGKLLIKTENLNIKLECEQKPTFLMTQRILMDAIFDLEQDDFFFN